MTDNGNISHFDPADHLEQIKSGNEIKPYLNPRNATTWFYHDHPAPTGKIITNVMRYEPTIVIRAEVWIDGEIVATGHADPDGRSVTLKKIESSAIRRALANAGYGTDQVISRIAKSIGVDAAKKLLGSNKADSERRMGGEPVGSGYHLSVLKTWALATVYAQNKIHMESSIKKLLETGKLPPALTLEEAKQVILNRHADQQVEHSSDIAEAI